MRDYDVVWSGATWRSQPGPQVAPVPPEADAVLALFRHQPGTWWHAAQLAGQLARSVSTVERALRILRERGLVERQRLPSVRQGQRSVVYRRTGDIHHEK